MKTRLIIVLAFLAGSAAAQEILTLPAAVEWSLKNNFSIILQSNAAAIAKNNNTAGNAGMLPSLGWTGTQNNTVYTTHQRAFSGTEKNVTNALNTSVNTGLQLNWTLFDGMNMFAGKQMLGSLQELGENTSRAVLENTVADVALAYYNIVQLKQVVKVNEEAVRLSHERLKIAEARFSLGSGSQLAVLQSTVDLNTDSTSLLNQLTLLDNARADMNFLLARDANTPFDIYDSIQLITIGSYEDLAGKAMQQNTELLAARMDERIAELDLRIAQSARYPKVAFQSGYNFIRQKSQTGFAEYNQSYGPYFGLTASYTLFNGFNTSRNIRNARVMLNSGEVTVQQTGFDIRTRILKLYNSYKTALGIAGLQQANVAVARTNEYVAFEKYMLGSLSDIELREAQKKLIDSQYQLLEAQFQAKQAEIEIMRLSGDLMGLF